MNETPSAVETPSTHRNIPSKYFTDVLSKVSSRVLGILQENDLSGCKKVDDFLHKVKFAEKAIEYNGGIAIITYNNIPSSFLTQYGEITFINANFSNNCYTFDSEVVYSIYKAIKKNFTSDLYEFPDGEMIYLLGKDADGNAIATANISNIRQGAKKPTEAEVFKAKSEWEELFENFDSVDKKPLSQSTKPCNAAPNLSKSCLHMGIGVIATLSPVPVKIITAVGYLGWIGSRHIYSAPEESTYQDMAKSSSTDVIFAGAALISALVFSIAPLFGLVIATPIIIYELLQPDSPLYKLGLLKEHHPSDHNDSLSVYGTHNNNDTNLTD